MTDYLAEYDATPDDQKYPLVRKWMKSEPLPFFAQLRKERPILVTPECTLVSRFGDITNLLKMPKVFTVNLYKSKMGVTDTEEGYLMAHDDDALHYREKSLMQGMLNREDLPGIRKLIAQTCEEVLASKNGKIEVVNEYTRYVPAVLVRDYFGLDGAEIKDLLRWSLWNQYDAFHNQPFDLNSPELSKHITDEHNKASAELGKYIAKLVGRKLVSIKLDALKHKFLGVFYLFRLVYEYLKNGKPDVMKDDIATRILKSSFDDDVKFDVLRKGINIGGLLIGAIETTSQAVAQALQFFIQQPDKLAELKKNAALEDTYLFDAMVWEALRFVPISPYMFRQASIDTSIAKGTEYETKVKAGTNVLLLTQSAMFDEYAYENPTEFNPNRNWYHHFNFGFGSHECMGKYVGMVMIPEMVRHIVQLPELEEQAPIDYKNGPFPEEYCLTWKV
ncbi:cytochrome P450 [Paraneptunicella aestuarii]|uniref:cytochrome P450 n=1 Tax=Paraneptunicella aestuarii TaxID=2831148 RepID=UPI001E607E70|nr:cytochrome P450 [Paraneptunicella aestuarii]UAA37354.1 cytochrome P450 [Paraneptunicella aestuarii]